MELRHLRYFVAVAEDGSLVSAARNRLNTSQPSLSRQIRDLESEVGAKLLERHPRGVELTDAGKVFLQHARSALAEVEAAAEGARRLGKPEQPVFAIGFLAGHETWLPQMFRILRGEAPDVEFKLSSQSSPDLADAIRRGTLDVALIRREVGYGISYRPIADEPLIAMLPSDHPLASRETISPVDLESEVYVGSATASPVVDKLVKSYAAKTGINLDPQFDAGSLSSAISMVISTGGISLVPFYARDLLTPNVCTRPLEGDPPMIELLLGYSESNGSALLGRLLARADELAASV